MTSAVHAGSARAAPDSISLGEPVGTSPLDERKKARAVVVGMWCAYITLMVGVFTLERGSLLELHKREQDAALTAATVTAAALVTRVALVGTPARRTAQGVTIVAYSVTAVSTVTNWILGTFPSPVVVDHFTQCRVHLVRWCEWVVLSFCMSFMIESINQRKLKWAWLFASSISASTACGLVLPYMRTLLGWWSVMAFSFGTYAIIFQRLAAKWRDARAQPREDAPGLTPRVRETARRTRVAFQLMLCCSVMWSWFVVVYFAEIAHVRFNTLAAFSEHMHYLPFAIEAFTDVLAKLVYASIISKLAEAVPDRYMDDEVKWFVQQMGVVWRRTTDVIVISTPITPVALQGAGRGGAAAGAEGASPRAITVETVASAGLRALLGGKADDAERFCHGAIHTVDLRAADAPASAPASAPAAADPGARGVCTADQLDLEGIVERSWRSALAGCEQGGGAVVRTQEWHVPGPDGLPRAFEAHVGALADNAALIIFVRDVTERLRRHEAEMQLVAEQAEKKLIAEAVARQKDEETNRFTRHEVKNGMLVALGSCDGLREMHESGVTSGAIVNTEYDLSFQRRVKDLGSTLKSTLDVVLAQAMARDVVHGSYAARHEALRLDELLVVAPGSTRRFPRKCRPSPFPALSLDPGLLQLVYRNAVSNACKYGARGEPVRTELEHDGTTLTVRVTNAPGPGHERLLAVDDPTAVFEKGVRMHAEAHDGDGGAESGAAAGLSAGDGGWVMHKCAEALGGACSISFEPRRTVFELRCPAEIHVTSEQVEQFLVPRTARAIAVDDSKVQRMLIHKTLLTLGFAPERIVVLGAADAEMEGFADYLLALMRQHPHAQVLAVVDENLERLDQSSTISGTLQLQRARAALSAEDEARLLSVVRSANDSPSDVDMYKSRAHGVVPKEAFEQAKVLERFAPLWLQRFGPPSHASVDRDAVGVEEIDVALAQEALELVQTVDRLSKQRDTWSRVWPALHGIKGHLRTMTPSGKGAASKARIERIAACIEGYRGCTEPPPKFAADEWPELRELVELHLSKFVPRLVATDAGDAAATGTASGASDGGND